MSYEIQLFVPATSTTFDITDRTRQVQILKVIDSGITTYQLECRQIQQEHLFNYITVIDNGQTLISGIITNQVDRWGGNLQEKLTTFTCQDWGYFLPKRIGAENYLNKTVSFILNDLFSKYAPDFTTTNVEVTTENIEETRFIYNTLKDGIDYLMGLSPDYHWYIDKDRDLHFFRDFEEEGTNITASKIKAETLQVENEGLETYNRVWIVGIKQPTANAIDVFYTSDGDQRFFGPLTDEPSGFAVFLTPIGLPEFQLSVALETEDDGSSFDMLFNPRRRVFYFPPYRSPGDYIGKLRTNFRPIRQFIDRFDNQASINQFGLMEKAIKNTTITDRLEARKYGRAEVRRASRVKRYLKFESDNVDIINSELGQRCQVNIVQGAWSITGEFRINRIAYNIIENRLTAQLELEELI